MLSFVGLGLYDEHSLTLEARDVLQAVDRVFAETYTSRLVGATIEDLEAALDVTVSVRDRAGIEQTPDPILDAAASGTAAFVTAGDPMIATTHVDLRLRAHDRGIETRVVHGVTAQTAASSLTGLQNYRFGPATTIPFPDTRGIDGVPESALETIRTNRDRGLHTICYLDIDAAGDRYMSADTAATILAEHLPQTVGVAIARAGSPDPLVRADILGTLADEDFGDPLHLLVIPGRCHDLEAEALLAFADAPADDLETV